MQHMPSPTLSEYLKITPRSWRVTDWPGAAREVVFRYSLRLPAALLHRLQVCKMFPGILEPLTMNLPKPLDDQFASLQRIIKSTIFQKMDQYTQLVQTTPFCACAHACYCRCTFVLTTPFFHLLVFSLYPSRRWVSRLDNLSGIVEFLLKLTTGLALQPQQGIADHGKQNPQTYRRPQDNY